LLLLREAHGLGRKEMTGWLELRIIKSCSVDVNLAIITKPYIALNNN
jgi:hypothetical protein